MRDISVMKKLLFALFFALGLFQVAHAQSAYKVHPNPCDTITTMDTYDSPAHGEIKNVSNSIITVKWERHEIFLTPNITTQVCDPVTCWFPGVSSKTFQLQKDSSGQLTVHFYNSASDPAPGQAGSGIVHLKLTNQNNSADTLTVIYTYNTLSGTNDLPVANVKLYPNPTTDYFTLTNAEEVASMRLFTIDGRILARFEHSSDNTYSIVNQPAGNYVLSFEDKNGQLFQAVEIHKQ
jgi:Secretion system C-terminal sorting domain